jgi:hypothetical protein
MSARGEERGYPRGEIGRLGLLPPCELVAPRQAKGRSAAGAWPEQIEAQAWLAAARDGRAGLPWRRRKGGRGWAR